MLTDPNEIEAALMVTAQADNELLTDIIGDGGMTNAVTVRTQVTRFKL